jgi:hypothetical protein
MLNFEYKDFPVVPDSLKDHILKLTEPLILAQEGILNEVPDSDYKDDDKDDSLGVYYQKQHIHKYDKSLAFLDQYDIGDVANQWINQNIIQHKRASLQVIHGGELVAPHKDNTPGDPSKSRKRALNYYFETGGDSAELVFYKPLEKYAHLILYPGTLVPFDRIEKIESIKIEPNRWHEIHTQTMHSVEFLDPTKKRIGLTITLE